jgi:putative Holliday junction resolvase
VGRVLGVDLGARRIGLAVSDPLGITAQGLQTLARQGGAADLAALAALAREQQVEQVILGLPLHMDGSEGASALGARRFAGTLEQALQVPVQLWDERLTTVQAERTLTGGGVRRQERRGHRDRLAAVLILQSWLHASRQQET